MAWLSAGPKSPTSCETSVVFERNPGFSPRSSGNRRVTLDYATQRPALVADVR